MTNKHGKIFRMKCSVTHNIPYQQITDAFGMPQLALLQV